jgi:hypothetical protein
LLGYEFVEQSWIAACVFELTQSAFRKGWAAKLVIHLNESQLSIVLSISKSQTQERRALAFPLPDKPSALDRNDLPWIVDELNRLTPLILFEEFRQQNLEILHLSSLLGHGLDRGEKGISAA